MQNNIIVLQLSTYFLFSWLDLLRTATGFLCTSFCLRRFAFLFNAGKYRSIVFQKARNYVNQIVFYSIPAMGKLRPTGPIRPIWLFYPTRGAQRAGGSLALPSAPSPAAVLTWQRSHKHFIHAFVPALRSSLRTHCGPRVKKFAYPWSRVI